MVRPALHAVPCACFFVPLWVPGNACSAVSVRNLGSWWLAFLFKVLSGILQTPSQPSHFKLWFGVTVKVKGPAYRGSEFELRPLPISLFKELAGYKFSHLKHRSILSCLWCRHHETRKWFLAYMQGNVLILKSLAFGLSESAPKAQIYCRPQLLFA